MPVIMKTVDQINIDMMKIICEELNQTIMRVFINPTISQILENSEELIDWYYLSSNPAAIHLLEANPDKIDWENLSSNPAAIHLLEANPDKIDWDCLCSNSAAIHLFETKSVWGSCISRNPAAIYLLMSLRSEDDYNSDEEFIDWEELSHCYWDPYPHTCVVDQTDMMKEMRHRRSAYVQMITKELQQTLFHPGRIQKWIEAGNDLEDYLQ
jgi:hypothetical protein